MHICHSVLAVVALVGLNAAPQSEMPETVLVTYHAKQGSEAALANAIGEQWAAMTSLKLVLQAPHTLVRGTEDGKTYFVEIFTWRDARIPDAAPPAIQNIWSEMNRLVESRGGKPGIDFTAVSLVAP
jgi:hypothetical protein